MTVRVPLSKDRISLRRSLTMNFICASTLGLVLINGSNTL